MSRIVIVILQYNNSHDTIRCLESVKGLNWQNFKAVVVDNASEIQHLNNIRLFIESQEKMRERRFKLILSKSNLGYAGGNNLGIKYALESGADYVFILNPDTTVKSNLLTKLAETAKKNSKAGIVGATIDEGDRVINCGKIEWLKSELSHNKIKPITPASALQNRGSLTFVNKSWDYNLKPKTYIIGAAMLIKKEVIKKIGLFDERYFLYFEDADYCLRASKAGYKLAIVPEAMVDHAVSASTSQLGSALLLRYHFRNAHLFNLKNGPWYIKFALPFWSFFITIKQLIKIFFTPSRREISRAILAGVYYFYMGRFGKIKPNA